MSNPNDNNINLDKLSIADFANELGSDNPAPGGGSSSALAGVLACSLISMVAKITLKKLKDDTARSKLEEIIIKSLEAKKHFLQLINDDTTAFNEIIMSYRLPKDTDSAQHQRSAAIQSATKHAAEVPLTTAELGLETLVWVKELTSLGAEQTITDLGVAGLMAKAAITGAIWNVKINLSTIKDKDFVSDMNKRINNIVNSQNTLWPMIRDAVENKI